MTVLKHKVISAFYKNIICDYLLLLYVIYDRYNLFGFIVAHDLACSAYVCQFPFHW